mmetsp:Transcript_282/g.891  ORF Transcript_282/g.891 Transcript_282/m.891 type:complete len:383 (+) Transcript_282:208-1356(+)
MSELRLRPRFVLRRPQSTSRSWPPRWTRPTGSTRTSSTRLPSSWQPPTRQPPRPSGQPTPPARRPPLPRPSRWPPPSRGRPPPSAPPPPCEPRWTESPLSGPRLSKPSGRATARTPLSASRRWSKRPCSAASASASRTRRRPRSTTSAPLQSAWTWTCETAPPSAQTRCPSTPRTPTSRPPRWGRSAASAWARPPMTSSPPAPCCCRTPRWWKQSAARPSETSTPRRWAFRACPSGRQGSGRRAPPPSRGPSRQRRSDPAAAGPSSASTPSSARSSESSSPSCGTTPANPRKSPSASADDGGPCPTWRRTRPRPPASRRWPTYRRRPWRRAGPGGPMRSSPPQRSPGRGLPGSRRRLCRPCARPPTSAWRPSRASPATRRPS